MFNIYTSTVFILDYNNIKTYTFIIKHNLRIFNFAKKLTRIIFSKIEYKRCFKTEEPWESYNVSIKSTKGKKGVCHEKVKYGKSYRRYFWCSFSI